MGVVGVLLKMADQLRILIVIEATASAIGAGSDLELRRFIGGDELAAGGELDDALEQCLSSSPLFFISPSGSLTKASISLSSRRNAMPKNALSDWMPLTYLYLPGVYLMTTARVDSELTTPSMRLLVRSI